MKLNVQHFNLKSTDELDSHVENRIFALQPRLQIDEAHVRLERHRESSPAFTVRIHLVTPGPDLFAERCDHTLQAAVEKAMQHIESRLAERAAKRRQRLDSNRQGPVGKARTGRTGHARRS